MHFSTDVDSTWPWNTRTSCLHHKRSVFYATVLTQSMLVVYKLFRTHFMSAQMRWYCSKNKMLALTNLLWTAISHAVPRCLILETYYAYILQYNCLTGKHTPCKISTKSSTSGFQVLYCPYFHWFGYPWYQVSLFHCDSECLYKQSCIHVQAQRLIRPEPIPVSVAWSNREYFYSPLDYASPLQGYPLTLNLPVPILVHLGGETVLWEYEVSCPLKRNMMFPLELKPRPLAPEPKKHTNHEFTWCLPRKQ